MKMRSGWASLLDGWMLSMVVVGALACSSEEKASVPSPEAAPNYDVLGQYPVGHSWFLLEDTARNRTFPVQVWYPARKDFRAVADEGVLLEELLPEGPKRELLADLIHDAPERCTTRRTHSAPDVTPALETFPVVLFSHCSGCVRFSASTIAERLASYGIAVVAPDHVGGTLFDQLVGELAPVGEAFGLVRVGDLQVTLATILNPSLEVVPAQLRGRFDASHVGVMGHSFGALAAGKMLHDDMRIHAGFLMAAPPSFLGVKVAEIQKPVFLLLAQEDNSIGKIGNNLLRSDYEKIPHAWLAEVKDAGHWSFSDICALTKSFQPGCGIGKRQEDKSEFSYLDIDQGRGIAASYAAAFFASTLKQEAAALEYVDYAHPSSIVQISKK